MHSPLCMTVLQIKCQDPLTEFISLCSENNLVPGKFSTFGVCVLSKPFQQSVLHVSQSFLSAL